MWATLAYIKHFKSVILNRIWEKTLVEEQMIFIKRKRVSQVISSSLDVHIYKWTWFNSVATLPKNGHPAKTKKIFNIWFEIVFKIENEPLFHWNLDFISAPRCTDGLTRLSGVEEERKRDSFLCRQWQGVLEVPQSSASVLASHLHTAEGESETRSPSRRLNNAFSKLSVNCFEAVNAVHMSITCCHWPGRNQPWCQGSLSVAS